MLTDEKIERVAFGLFEADLHSGELWKAGHKIRLPRQPFRVLTALLMRHGEVVTREELQREIWGQNTNVDFDQALAAAVNKIREALGDSAEHPRYIQTLPKRGYRFIAPVAPTHSESAAIKAANRLQPETSDSPVVSTLADGRPAAEEATHLLSPPTDAENLSTTPFIGVIETQLSPQSEMRVGLTAGLRFITKGRRNLWFLGVSTLCIIAGALFDRFLSPKELRTAPFRVEQISHYVPISLGPPNPETFLSMAMNGDRVLTSVMVNGLPRLSAVDVDTGDVQKIDVPNEITSNALADLSKDASRLLLRSQQSTESEQPLWIVPTAGGSGRRVPGVVAHDAAWMPDGSSILYATGNDLAVIGSNEDSSALYAKLPGRAFWLRWSPDGRLLRFTLFDPATHTNAIWEIKAGSPKAAPVLVGNKQYKSACCGVWLPDGKSYVFQADDDLWELSGVGSHTSSTQLTNGPLRSLFPLASRDGNRVFFVGLEAPSGLQQFDSSKKQFRSAPAFLADANRVEYSNDGKWVAWTDIYEKLWRARADGSDKVRLTSDALEVFLAHWSPTAKKLAVMARKPGGLWQIYIVDASGGKAEALLDEGRNAADPGWSADGNSIVFGRQPDLMGKENGPRTLQLIDLSSHRIEEIPNSDNLFSPRWSPDGRWIVALTLDQKTVKLYDTAHHHWQSLASTSAADPVWSADSKAIFLHAFLADGEPILRIEVPSGTIHTIATLGNFHDREAANYFFGGITPQGEPLVQPRVGTGNLYALDLTAN